jgi:hypothetical protein
MAASQIDGLDDCPAAARSPLGAPRDRRHGGGHGLSLRPQIVRVTPV